MILQTGWGTRAGIGDPTAATAAADKNKAASQEKLEEENVTVSPVPRYPDAERYHQPAVELQEGYAR